MRFSKHSRSLNELLSDNPENLDSTHVEKELLKLCLNEFEFIFPKWGYQVENNRVHHYNGTFTILELIPRFAKKSSQEITDLKNGLTEENAKLRQAEEKLIQLTTLNDQVNELNKTLTLNNNNLIQAVRILSEQLKVISTGPINNLNSISNSRDCSSIKCHKLHNFKNLGLILLSGLLIIVCISNTVKSSIPSLSETQPNNTLSELVKEKYK